MSGLSQAVYPDRYRFDRSLADDVLKKFLSARYNVARPQISLAEVSILQCAYSESNFFRTRADDPQAFKDAMGSMAQAAQRAYLKGDIGSWSFGAIMVYARLGMTILGLSEERGRLPALQRWKSQTISAQVLASQMTLWSVVGVSVRWLVDFNLGHLVPLFLNAQGKVLGGLIDDVQKSPTMTEWFVRIQALAPVSDSVFGVYWTLAAMSQQKQINLARLNAIPGLGPEIREAEENRLDELSAYLVSHAIDYYLQAGEHACADYIAGLLALAAQSGERGAKRQTKFDVARLWIPSFLAEDACRAVDSGGLPAWAAGIHEPQLGSLSGGLLGVRATFRT